MSLYAAKENQPTTICKLLIGELIDHRHGYLIIIIESGYTSVMLTSSVGFIAFPKLFVRKQYKKIRSGFELYAIFLLRIFGLINSTQSSNSYPSLCLLIRRDIKKLERFYLMIMSPTWLSLKKPNK